MRVRVPTAAGSRSAFFVFVTLAVRVRPLPFRALDFRTEERAADSLVGRLAPVLMIL